jgi:hypothetical protein
MDCSQMNNTSASNCTKYFQDKGLSNGALNAQKNQCYWSGDPKTGNVGNCIMGAVCTIPKSK